MIRNPQRSAALLASILILLAATFAAAPALAGEGRPSPEAVQAFEQLKGDPHFQGLKQGLRGHLHDRAVVDAYLQYLPVPPMALHHAERWLTRSEMPVPRVLAEWNLRWLHLHPEKAAHWREAGTADAAMAVDALAGASVSGNENMASGSGNDPIEYQGEIQLVVNPSNPSEMVAAANTWDDINGTCGDYGMQAVFYTADGGATWGYSCPPDAPDFQSAGVANAPNCSSLGGGTFGSDPALHYDASGNVFLEYMLLCYNGNYYYSVVVAKSSTGGATWTPWGVVVNSYSNGSLEDKNFYAIDNNAGSPYLGRHYTCWDRSNNEKSAYSTNGGQTWHEVDLPTSSGGCSGKGLTARYDLGCEFAIDANGTVHVVFDTITCGARNCTCESMYHTQSTNGGLSWSTPNLVRTFNLAGFSTDSCPDAQNDRCIGPFGSVDIDNSGGPRDGTLYATFTDHTGGGASTADVWMSKSTNGGSTWSAPVKMNDDATSNTQFHPFLVVDQTNGDVVAAWHDARNDPGNDAVDFYLARSTNGSSFEPNVQLSAPSSDFWNSGISWSDQNTLDNPNYNGNQYGEYLGLDARGGKAYVAWSDTRQYFPNDPGDGEQENVGFAVVDFGGGGPTNQSPTASFSESCTLLSCSFDASASNDPDGSISSYAWTFGDGGTGTGATPNHTYAAGGTYTVGLTVTDNQGATGFTSHGVTVTAGGGGGITLTASGYKVKGVQNVDLAWSGASGTNVDVFRDSAKISTTANDGAYTDNIGKKGPGTYVYKVCEAGSSTCSGDVTVVF